MSMKKLQALKNIKRKISLFIRTNLDKGGIKLAAEKTKKKGSVLKYIVLILIIALVAGGLFVKNYLEKSLEPMTSENHQEIDIEIPAGSSTNKIANILEDKGLIRNNLIFKYKVRSMEVDSKLKAGKYNLSTSMDMEEIIQAITKGGISENTVRFTIPEGYEVKQTGERLAENGIVDFDKFMELANDKGNFESKFAFLQEIEDGQSLEGFLYPSTYEIFTSSSEVEVIEKMLSEFEKIYREEIIPNIEATGLDLNELITMASIVEREGKLDEERPIMAGVFYNRLDQGMNLQSCATVQYILGERKPVLSTADTQIPSPFNTYTNPGLPPSPIASPGKASLIASVKPADVDYLFFVLTGDDGSHTFTKTYNEHLDAKPKK